MGFLSLLQGIFPTQGLNPGLPLQVDSLPAEPQGKPNKEASLVKSLLSFRGQQPGGQAASVQRPTSTAPDKWQLVGKSFDRRVGVRGKLHA